MVRFPTRWSDFWPLALLPTKWLDFLPPEVVGNPTNCAPGMETKHCTMGKLFCKSCSRHVLSGSRNCHLHFLFFVLQLLPWVVKHCLVVLFLVQKTEVSKPISTFSSVFKYLSSSSKMSETTKQWLEQRKAVVGQLQGRLPVPGSNSKTPDQARDTWISLNFLWIMECYEIFK